MLSQKKQILVLFCIVLAGAGLRFYRLDYQSLWNDELYTWKCSASDRWNEDGHASWERGINSSVGKTIDTAIYDIHPPGYLVIIHYFSKYFGDSECMLRLPSALFGTLAIVMIYLLGAHLYTQREGVIAAGLMSFLWCPIYYSQEARTYSMLLFTTLAAVYFWLSILRALHTKGELPHLLNVAGYIAAAGISCWLHYFGMYFIILQGLASSLLFARRIRCLLLITFAVNLPVALTFLPWLPVTLMHFRLNAPTYATPDATAFFKYIKFCFNESVFFFLLVSFLCGVFLYRLIKEAGRRGATKLLFSPEAFLCAWLIVPFLGAYLKSISGSGSVYQNKNLIISLPAAYILLARAVTLLPLSRLKQTGAATLLIAGFLWHLLFVMDYYHKPVKQQFREGVQYIIDHHIPEEETFIIGNAWDKDFYNYYFEKKGSSLRAAFNPIYLFLHPGGFKQATKRTLRSIEEKKAKNIWFISSFEPPPQPYIDFLNQHLKLVDYKQFIHIRVWHYTKT